MTIRKDLLIIMGVSLVSVLVVLYVSLNYFPGWFVVLGLGFSVGIYIIWDRLQREQQVTESHLKQSEQKYQSFFENAVEGMFQSTPDGRIINVNPAMAHIFGYDSPQEMVASITNISTQIYTNPDDRDKLRQSLQTNGRVDNFEAYEYRKDGTIIRISTSARVVRDEAGNPLYYEGFLQDITGRNRAEDTLRESELKFRAIVEQSSEGIALLDEEGNVIEWNQANEKMTDLQRHEVLGRPFWEVSMKLASPERRTDRYYQLVKSIVLEALQTGKSYLFAQPVGRDIPIHNSQGKRTIQQAYFPIKTEKGYRIASLTHDITERKQAEEALQNNEKRFRALIENGLDNISLLAADGTLLWESPAVIRNLGYAPGAFIGRNTFELMHPDDRGWTRSLFAELLRQPGTRQQGAFRLLRSDGAWRWVEAVATNLLHEPSVAAIVLNYRDVTDRKQAEDKIQRQLERFAAQSEIDHTITSSFDLRLSLTTVLTHVIAQLGVDAAAVLLFNPGLQMLEYGAGRGFHTKAIERTRLRLGEDYAGRAALEGRITHIANLAEQPHGFLRAPLLAGEAFVSYYAVPLVAKGQIKGVLEVFHRTTLEPDEEWFDFLKALADQTAIAIDNAKLFDSLQRSNDELALAYEATIEGWSRALDLRDKETEGHTQRVTEMTLQLARSLGFSEEELVQVRRGALLHDIGKMGVPDSILLKPGPLTDEEWVVMRKHTEYGYELLYPIQYLRPALDIPYAHHEKWDGSGYPRGLKGEQIPLAARIFAIVDVWDALRSDRPYRDRWPEEKVQQHLRSQSGTHFDPKVVGVFLDLLIDQ